MRIDTLEEEVQRLTGKMKAEGSGGKDSNSKMEMLRLEGCAPPEQCAGVGLNRF